jgi:hypothetical protein
MELVGQPLFIIDRWHGQRGCPCQRSINIFTREEGECGITDTSRADLWQDYGVSLIRNLLIPVWQWTRGIQPIIWWPHLERGWMAFEDSGEKNLL